MLLVALRLALSLAIVVAIVAAVRLGIGMRRFRGRAQAAARQQLLARERGVRLLLFYGRELLLQQHLGERSRSSPVCSQGANGTPKAPNNSGFGSLSPHRNPTANLVLLWAVGVVQTARGSQPQQRSEPGAARARG